MNDRRLEFLYDDVKYVCISYKESRKAGNRHIIMNIYFKRRLKIVLQSLCVATFKNIFFLRKVLSGLCKSHALQVVTCTKLMKNKNGIIE